MYFKLERCAYDGSGADGSCWIEINTDMMRWSRIGRIASHYSDEQGSEKKPSQLWQFVIGKEEERRGVLLMVAA